jgi:hypothetical protein
VAFRFQIRETWKARPPVVVLTGDLLEGEVRVGDRIAVPLTDGSTLVRVVLGLLAGRADLSAEAASVADGFEWVGIGFERRDGQRTEDIALGTVTDAEPDSVPSSGDS